MEELAALGALASMMLEHDFRPGFRVELHIKDLANALAAAHATASPRAADRPGDGDAGDPPGGRRRKRGPQRPREVL